MATQCLCCWDIITHTGYIITHINVPPFWIYHSNALFICSRIIAQWVQPVTNHKGAAILNSQHNVYVVVKSRSIFFCHYLSVGTATSPRLFSYHRLESTLQMSLMAFSRWEVNTTLLTGYGQVLIKNVTLCEFTFGTGTTTVGFTFGTGTSLVPRQWCPPLCVWELKQPLKKNCIARKPVIDVIVWTFPQYLL